MRRSRKVTVANSIVIWSTPMPAHYVCTRGAKVVLYEFYKSLKIAKTYLREREKIANAKLI